MVMNIGFRGRPGPGAVHVARSNGFRWGVCSDLARSGFGTPDGSKSVGPTDARPTAAGPQGPGVPFSLERERERKKKRTVPKN